MPTGCEDAGHVRTTGLRREIPIGRVLKLSTDSAKTETVSVSSNQPATHRQSPGLVLCVSEYVFSTQEVHACGPGVLLYVPLAQGVQVVGSAPVKPASQIQAAAVALAGAKDVDPTAHSWHDPAPA